MFQRAKPFSFRDDPLEKSDIIFGNRKKQQGAQEIEYGMRVGDKPAAVLAHKTGAELHGGTELGEDHENENDAGDIVDRMGPGGPLPGRACFKAGNLGGYAASDIIAQRQRNSRHEGQQSAVKEQHGHPHGRAAALHQHGDDQAGQQA
ncbi:hypothetical protein SDC9_209276 [bioreactor metagenome]|uniref:Uncharacterized protein n=1 Tax=bioreactor metagenome TaxID=1076179 RepID=A0A645JCW4_9ZZZZ